MIKAAIYCRLSDEDRNKKFKTDDSESIQNQKLSLTDYVKEKGWELYDLYVDEDYSGSERNRPDWNRMIADAQKHCFNVIVCKSQQRFARDMAAIELYLHEKFIEWGIRFIGVTDHADTDNPRKQESKTNQPV